MLENWPYKLLALIIAMALWAFVVGQEKAEITVRVPVEITGLPQDLVLGNQVDSEVEVRLYGPQNLVRQVSTRPRVKQLDLAGLAAGDHIFQVLPEDLNLPPAVSVVRISPSRLRVSLAPRFSREAAVRPVIKGNPPAGYEVAEVTFTPPTVKVSGLEQELADLDWVWTVPLDVSRLKNNATLKAVLRPPAGRTIRLIPATVQAQINIRRQPAPEAAGPPAGKSGGANDQKAKAAEDAARR
ncbi:MAG: YbbR-like domain-containing protein [Desulfarculus sp.]|nr:MAG: YbbR-like domain-containing protein [Desulfarculus sp.]